MMRAVIRKFGGPNPQKAITFFINGEDVGSVYPREELESFVGALYDGGIKVVDLTDNENTSTEAV